MGNFNSNDSTSSLIDVHAHFIPDSYREALIDAGHTKPDGMPAIPQWSESAMLATMDRLGITTALLSISSPGVHFGDDVAARKLARQVNDEGARLSRVHPNRFGHLASLPLPDVSGALTEIEYALDVLSVDGFILESNSGGIYPGDPEFEPIFVELDRRGAVVLLHPTSPHCTFCSILGSSLPSPILEFMFETTRAVTNLILKGTLDRFPNVQFIVPHAGAALPALIDRVAMAAAMLPEMGGLTPDKIFAILGRLYFDLAGVPLPRLLPALRSFADPTKLLYGSDWPFTPEPVAAILLENLDVALSFDPSLLKAMRYENARVLFPRH